MRQNLLQGIAICQVTSCKKIQSKWAPVSMTRLLSSSKIRLTQTLPTFLHLVIVIKVIDLRIKENWADHLGFVSDPLAPVQVFSFNLDE